MSEQSLNYLREEAKKLSADDLIRWACTNIHGINQFDFIKIFKSAFPQIPLRILNEASTSYHLVGEKGLDSVAIDNLLEPWLKELR